MAADLPLHSGGRRRDRRCHGTLPPRWPGRHLDGPGPGRRDPPPRGGRRDRREYGPASVKRSHERRGHQLGRGAAIRRDDGRVTLRAAHRHRGRHHGAVEVLARRRRRTGVGAGAAVLPVRVGPALHCSRRHRHLPAHHDHRPRRRRRRSDGHPRSPSPRLARPAVRPHPAAPDRAADGDRPAPPGRGRVGDPANRAEPGIRRSHLRTRDRRRPHPRHRAGRGCREPGPPRAAHPAEPCLGRLRVLSRADRHPEHRRPHRDRQHGARDGGPASRRRADRRPGGGPGDGP